MPQPQQPPRHVPSGRPEDHEPRLELPWENYLAAGYFDGDGNLRPEYVAREKVEPFARRLANAHPPLTTHQLRRFFQHCRAIEAKVRARKESWEKLRPDFLKLDFAAADALGKSPSKIPKLFHDFIRRNVAAVRTQDDFLKGFLPHFEALVGLGSQHLQGERRS